MIAGAEPNNSKDLKKRKLVTSKCAISGQGFGGVHGSSVQGLRLRNMHICRCMGTMVSQDDDPYVRSEPVRNTLVVGGVECEPCGMPGKSRTIVFPRDPPSHLCARRCSSQAECVRPVGFRAAHRRQDAHGPSCAKPRVFGPGCHRHHCGDDAEWDVEVGACTMGHMHHTIC